MIIRLLRYIRGYVAFSIKGEYPERLLNQLAANGISVWGMRRRKEEIEAFMPTKDYAEIRRCRKKNKVRTKVLKRYGLPVFMKRHKLRVGFALGAALYICALFVLSMFIWNINIVGNKETETAEIKEVCKEIGLKEGALRSDINTGRLKAMLALKLENAAWVSVNIEGVAATVNISEIEKAEKRPEKEPCNLVAERDGIITAVEATSGTVSVKVGQTVGKGELLVSGITEYKNGTYRFGAAEGRIIAETERELSVFVPFSQTETVRTGETVKRSVLSFMGLNIPLYFGSVKGTCEVDTDVAFFERDGRYLPVYLTTAIFYKTESVQRVLSYDEAVQKGEVELEKLKETELSGAEILRETVETDRFDDGVRITAAYKCRENIAKQDLLLILDEK